MTGRLPQNYGPAVATGRSLSLDRCDEIAPLLERGVAMSAIARRLAVPYALVARRVSAMRRHLTTSTGDGAWMDTEARTNVEVGKAWVEKMAQETARERS